MNPLVNHYNKDTVLSAPPEKLVVMLYNKALQNLNQALKYHDQNDWGQFGLNLGKCQAIVAEFLNSLDHEAGGEISKNLEKLYLFVIDRLIQANLKKDSGMIRESIDVLKNLKEGFDHAVRQTCGAIA